MAMWAEKNVVVFQVFFIHIVIGFFKPIYIRKCINNSKNISSCSARCGVNGQVIQNLTITYNISSSIFPSYTAYSPISSCPEGYISYPFTSNLEPEMCIQYNVRPGTFDCPPGWSLNEECVCTRSSSLPTERQCTQEFQMLGNMCVKDEFAMRELVCPENYTLNNASECIRSFLKPASIRCAPGFVWVSSASRCERYEFALPQLACLEAFPKQPNELTEYLACEEASKTKRSPACRLPLLWFSGFHYFEDAMLRCPQNFFLNDQLCERIYYVEPRRRCPPNFVLDKKICRERWQSCSDTDKKLCIHSIPAHYQCLQQHEKARHKCIEKSIKGKGVKFSCLNAYKLYLSEFDARCIHVSESTQCLSQKISFYEHNDQCNGSTQDPLVICEEGVYDKRLEMCVVTQYKLPSSSCSTVYLYKDQQKFCLIDKVPKDVAPVMLEDIQKSVLCRSLKGFPIKLECPANYIIQYMPHFICVHHRIRSPVITCPPDFHLLTPTLNGVNGGQFLCEKVAVVPAKNQCPRLFHEGKGHVCVRQKFIPIKKICPSNDSGNNTRCLQRLTMKPIISCPDGFQPTNSFSSSTKESSCEHLCFNQSFISPTLSCREGDTLDLTSKMCHKVFS